MEVTARVKTQLRRFTRYNPSNGEAAEKHSCEYDLRGLYINKDTHKCKLYEQDLNLTPMEFSILWYLCDHMGKVVSSDELFEAVKKVYDGSPDAISLSTPLQEVENQLNYVKLNVQKNENVAREAEQRKNDLVVYLAHDLKTPLTSVIGYLTLLRDERNISEELQEKYLDISLEKAERLEDLINEFFEIARFNLTTLTLDESSINLTRMLEQVVFEFQPMLNEKNLTCHISAPKDLIYRCDANKMQRVFDNLLRNAVNYSFPNSDILIHAEVENDLLRICFQNHGNTISKDKLDRIFEQFFRLDTARASRSSGSGLALDISAAGYDNDQVYQWLFDHAAEYGFILRYPSDKTEITGIDYEPWHYRYVGKGAAEEIMTSGLCLEEYLQSPA